MCFPLWEQVSPFRGKRRGLGNIIAVHSVEKMCQENEEQLQEKELSVLEEKSQPSNPSQSFARIEVV